MALKGQAKADYQREYMRGYMQRRRADVKTLVKTQDDVRPMSLRAKRSNLKMGFEPKLIAELDADGNAMPGD